MMKPIIEAERHPKPTHYTEEEDGLWSPWPPLIQSVSTQSGAFVKVAAVKFDNGTIFDLIVGNWRLQPNALEEKLDQIRHELHERNVCSSPSELIFGPVHIDCILRAVRAALQRAPFLEDTSAQERADSSKEKA